MIGAEAGFRRILCASAAVALAGCATPLGQREAVAIASQRMSKYCGASAECRPLTLSRAQKMDDGWLVQFEASSRSYGVMVEADGNTQLSIWDKSLGAAR